MTKHFVARHIVLAALAVLPMSAHAATVTANMPVSATVGGACSVSSGGLAFGSYEPVLLHSAAALVGSGTIDVACTLGTGAVVTLGQGANSANGSTDAAPARQLASGASRLAYALYRDLAMSLVWGNTSGTGLAITGTGVSVGIPVYGAVAAAQNVPQGAYSDTVVVTVTF